MISVVMLSKNSSETIAKSLKSLKGFDEVILLDTGSNDNTLNIVKKFKNTKVFEVEFTQFGKLRNLGAKFAKNDWILNIDSDEVLSDDLKKEILKANLDKNSIYGFLFQNYYNNKLIKCCGWHKEKHIRLYNKTKTKFSNNLVHEKIETKKIKQVFFKNPIKHYSYRKIDDFLNKMIKYTSLFAQQNKRKKKSSFSKAFFHGFFAFLKSFILKKGFLSKEGFIISLYNANTSFYKYLKLLEINQKNKK